MLSINLSSDVEKHLIEVVQDNYNGNLQEAIKSFLKLQAKYGWKEQLLQDGKPTDRNNPTDGTRILKHRR
ncbi:hypothetical protein H8E88_21275 [candidate division KSB1 bacterium]|nr:hypothetical protein [candidate division KSB1 bacterium]MBL7093752.1 hypothetical protein [candidate division KSB1 bacterium]